MAQQLHLGDGVLHGHGLDGELLGAHDVVALLLEGGGLDHRLQLGGADALLQLGAVAANLALQLVHGVVDGEVHIIGGFLRAQDHACGVDGDFHDVAGALLNLEADGRFGLLAEVALQLAELLFNPGFQAVRDRHVLACINKLHDSIAPLFRNRQATRVPTAQPLSEFAAVLQIFAIS